MLPGRSLVGLAASLLALAAAGCGDDGSTSGATGSGGVKGSGGTDGGAGGAPGGSGADPGGSGGSGGSSSPGRPADPATAQVIRAWSDALRRGDVRKAASYFAIPSVVQNGTPPVRLNEPAEALAFNTSLPCGARLKATKRTGRYTVATFVLTKRPGGDCGPGAGGEAATAFVVTGGKIREWRRVPDPSERPPPPGRGAPPPTEEPLPGGPTV